MTDSYHELIPNDKIKKFQEEINSWKKLFKSRMENNILMKYTVGNILKNVSNKNLLEEIEEFQNRFIREDEITDLLRNDVAKFDELSYGQLFKGEKMRESCIKRKKRLSEDIIQSEKEYSRLISSFEDFLRKINKRI